MAQRRLTIYEHERDVKGGNIVYPVLSRRSGGISVGINTEPSGACNFDCVYCEVDRTGGIDNKRKFSIDRMENQLREMLKSINDGSFFIENRTDYGDSAKLMDIALSGDGEPSSLRNFHEVIGRILRVKRETGFPDLKVVVITNAAGLHRKTVQEGLQLLDTDNGDLWLKLDAGTEAYFNVIAKTRVEFKKILSNILEAAKKRTVKIQTCFMNLRGSSPDNEELQAYCQRINDILMQGGQIRAIQLYTVARKPPSNAVTALTKDQMLEITEMLRSKLQIPIETYEPT